MDEIKVGLEVEIWDGESWNEAIVVTTNEQYETPQIRSVCFIDGHLKGKTSEIPPLNYIGACDDMEGVRWRFPQKKSLLELERAIFELITASEYLGEGDYSEGTNLLGKEIKSIGIQAKKKMKGYLDEKMIMDEDFDLVKLRAYDFMDFMEEEE